MLGQEAGSAQPHGGTPASWARCQELLPHALAAADHAIQSDSELVESASLRNWADGAAAVQPGRSLFVQLGERHVDRAGDVDLTDDPSPEARFASAVIEPLQAQPAAVLDRAVTRGELRPRPDVPMVHSLLVGPLMAHLLLPLGTEPEDFASRVVAAVVAGLKSQDR